MKSSNPWWWIPTLYFAEGIPYFLVNNISVTMFNRMGVPNGEMALFTGLLYLPWTIKPLWSPFVDILRTRRWWIVAMQVLMAAAFVLLALTIPHPEAEMISEGATPMSLFTLTLILFVITAFASATHDIAADGFYMLALDKDKQSFFVGIRSTFYRLSSVFGQGVLVMIAGLLEQRTGNIPAAWRTTIGLTALIFAAVSIYHIFALPRPAEDINRSGSGAREILTGFGRAFGTFFRKKEVWLAMAFMLLYRLPEAFLLKMVNPFLLDPLERGGLALQTSTVGLLYGTIGVIALTVGGILGGIAASRWGLRKCLIPMALCLELPCAVYIYMSMAGPGIVPIGICAAIEQFGYGFGFTAYMLYMMYFSEGEFKTSHYAICTAFMALSMMIPGMFAGYIQEAMGYTGFFVFVMICCVPAILVTLWVRKRLAK